MASRRADRITCRPALGDREIVTDDQMDLFCSIVQFQPGEGRENYDLRHAYITRTAPLMKKLNFPLSRPNPVLRKALLPKQSEYTHLCDMHKGLNADFVHQWFTLLALEVGLRMNSLIAAGRTEVGELFWKYPLMHLRQLHRIWLSHEKVRDAFGKTLDQHNSESMSGLSLHRQNDGCEACILSRIGSHLQTILALRCVSHSRLGPIHFSRYLRRMRMERLLAGWLLAWQNFIKYDFKQKTQYEIALKRNSEIARILHEKRKQIRNYGSRRNDKAKNLTHVSTPDTSCLTDKCDELEDGGVLQTIFDAENDIIDTYAALRTTCYLPNSGSQSSELHVNRRAVSRKVSQHNPITSLNSPGTDFPLDRYNSETRPHVFPNEAYNESTYTVDTVRNNARVLETSSAFPISLTPNIPTTYRDFSATPRLYTWKEENRQSNSDEISPTRKSNQAKALQMLELGSQLPQTRYSPLVTSRGVGKKAQDAKLLRDHTTNVINSEDLTSRKKERLASDTTTFSVLLRLDEGVDSRPSWPKNHHQKI